MPREDERNDAGAGAQASSTTGVATGRQAYASYQRPEEAASKPEAPAEAGSGPSQSATAGVSGHASADSLQHTYVSLPCI